MLIRPTIIQFNSVDKLVKFFCVDSEYLVKIKVIILVSRKDWTIKIEYPASLTIEHRAAISMEFAMVKHDNQYRLFGKLYSNIELLLTQL